MFLRNVPPSASVAEDHESIVSEIGLAKKHFPFSMISVSIRKQELRLLKGLCCLYYQSACEYRHTDPATSIDAQNVTDANHLLFEPFGPPRPISSTEPDSAIILIPLCILGI